MISITCALVIWRISAKEIADGGYDLRSVVLAILVGIVRVKQSVIYCRVVLVGDRDSDGKCRRTSPHSDHIDVVAVGVRRALEVRGRCEGEYAAAADVTTPRHRLRRGTT